MAIYVCGEKNANQGESDSVEQNENETMLLIGYGLFISVIRVSGAAGRARMRSPCIRAGTPPETGR